MLKDVRTVSRFARHENYIKMWTEKGSKSRIAIHAWSLNHILKKSPKYISTTPKIKSTDPNLLIAFHRELTVLSQWSKIHIIYFIFNQR